MARIFISYARKYESFARKLAAALSNAGADVWLDVEDIPAGDELEQCNSTGGLDAGELMLVIITPESMGSANVEQEWQYYVDEKKPIIPILLVPAKIHFQLRRMQYIDFHNQSFELAFRQLHSELKRNGVKLNPLSPEEKTVPIPVQPELPVKEETLVENRRLQSQRLTFAAAGIAMLALLVLIVSVGLPAITGRTLDPTRAALLAAYDAQETEAFNASATINTYTDTPTPTLTNTTAPTDDLTATAQVFSTQTAAAVQVNETSTAQALTQAAQLTANAPTNTIAPSPTSTHTLTPLPTNTLPPATPTLNLTATAQAVANVTATAVEQVTRAFEAAVATQTAAVQATAMANPMVNLAGSIQSVCLVTDLGRINDGGFNQSAYNGILRAESELGLDTTFIETQNQADYAANIDTCISDGYDAVVTVGFLIADATYQAALDNPDVYFIGVDQFVVEPLPNLVGLQFREDQAGFLAGAMAGLMTTSNIIAGVYGEEIPPVVKFRNGFEQGAKYVNPDVEILGVYVGSFVAPAEGAQVASQLIIEGADVIFGVGGPTGSGAILQAATQGVMVIGVDQDEFLTTFDNGETPGAEFIISSAIKRVDEGVYQMLNALSAGDYSFPTNSLVVLDAARDGVGFAPANLADVPEEVSEQVQNIFELLKSGELQTGVDPVTGQVLAIITQSNTAPVINQNQNTPISLIGRVKALEAGINLNVRRSPASNSAVMGNIASGESIRVIAISQDFAWAKIDYRGTTGWVAMLYIEIEGDWTELPVAIN